MQKVVSSKFAAKIQILEKLSELPDLVPCKDIDIPDEILEYHVIMVADINCRYNEKLYPDDKMEVGQREATKDDTMTSKSLNKKREGHRKEKLFGKDMSLVTEGAVETPDPILSLIMYLKTNALDEEELFRKSAPASEIADLKDRLDKDMEVQWSKFDVPTLAGLLKAYVRELPSPLIPASCYIHLTDITRLEGQQSIIEHIRDRFLSQIDAQPLALLAEIMSLLKCTVEHSARNGMSMRSVVTVWTPNLIRHEDPAEEMRRMSASQRLVQCMIEYYDDLF